MDEKRVILGAPTLGEWIHKQQQPWALPEIYAAIFKEMPYIPSDFVIKTEIEQEIFISMIYNIRTCFKKVTDMSQAQFPDRAYAKSWMICTFNREAPYLGSFALKNCKFSKSWVSYGVAYLWGCLVKCLQVLDPRVQAYGGVFNDPISL